MLKSMTAYGRASLCHHLGRFTVELKSVNRRHQEFAWLLPSELQRFETDLRKWIAPLVSRGQLTVKVNIDLIDKPLFSVKANLPLARELYGAWQSIANALQLPPEKNTCSLATLASYPGIISYGEELHDEQLLLEALHNAVNMALERLLDMKIREGALLHRDLTDRLAKISTSIAAIEHRMPMAIEKYHQKLTDRIAQLLPDIHGDNHNAIIREVALYAVKADITEEIVRLKAHIQQFSEQINRPHSDGIGKTLEFLLQEMLREANTCNSKADDLGINELIIGIKSEIERIREQVHNVE